MSKTLKRIFSAALVLCMLLAVLPATASAEDATNSTVYNFAWTDTTAEGYVSSKGMPAHLAYNYDNRATTPNNWYFLNDAVEAAANYSGTDITSPDTFLGSGGIGPNQGFTGTWGHVKFIYLLLEVPTAGYYDIGALHAPNTKGRWRLHFTKATEDDVATVNELAISGGSLDNPKITNDTSFEKILDFNVTGSSSSGVNSIAILGNQYFEAGSYLLFMDAYDNTVKEDTTDCRNKLKSLILTPSVQEGKILEYAHEVVTNGVVSVQSAWDASNGQVALSRKSGFTGITNYDLFGNQVKLDTLSSAYGTVIKDSKGTGSITFTNSVGAAVPMVLNTGYQEQLPLSSDNKTFMLTDATVTLASEIQEAKDAEGNAVEADGAFVFAVNMPEAAYDYGTEGLTVTMKITNETTEETYKDIQFAGEEMQGSALNDWSSQTKYFYANIKGLDAVAGQSLKVRVVVACGGTAVEATQTYAIPAAA